MSQFNFILEHLEGASNLFADLLSRWHAKTKPYPEFSPCIAVVKELNQQVSRQPKKSAKSRELRNLESFLTPGPRLSLDDTTDQPPVIVDDTYLDPVTPIENPEKPTSK